MSEKPEYIKLTDVGHYNTVIRCFGSDWQMYFRHVGWKHVGIMLRYFCDESDDYDKYEEISEEEARKLVEKQGGDLYAPVIEK